MALSNVIQTVPDTPPTPLKGGCVLGLRDHDRTTLLLNHLSHGLFRQPLPDTPPAPLEGGTFLPAISDLAEGSRKGA